MGGGFNEGVFRTRPHESGEPKTDLAPFWFDPDTEKPNPPKGLVSGGFWLGLGDIPIIHDKAPRAHQVSQYGFCNIAAATRSRG